MKKKETILQTIRREYHGWIKEYGKPPKEFELTNSDISELRTIVENTPEDGLGIYGEIWGVPIKMVKRKYVRKKDTKTFPLF